jgi:hypothetical protein
MGVDDRVKLKPYFAFFMRPLVETSEMAITRKHRSTRKQAGGAFSKATGTKAEVFHGTAKHTSGGLFKKDLMKTRAGRIVSKKKHAAGLKAIKKLRKLGFVAKKGTFKLFSKKRGGSKSSFGGMDSLFDAA